MSKISLPNNWQEIEIQGKKLYINGFDKLICETAPCEYGNLSKFLVNIKFLFLFLVGESLC